MKYKRFCARCFSKKVYVVRREKYRCANCKYEWNPYKFPLHLSKKEWIDILRWFLRGMSSKAISYETGINRWRILRALTKVRIAVLKDVPDVFNGTVEIDETYLGGQWKNKRKSQRQTQSKRGRGTLKTPVFGILCRSGKVWAEIVPDVGATNFNTPYSQTGKTGFRYLLRYMEKLYRHCSKRLYSSFGRAWQG